MKEVNIIRHDCSVGLGSTIMRALHCLYYRDPSKLYYFDFYNLDYSDKNVWNTFFNQPFKDQIGTEEVKANYINDIWAMGDFFLCYGRIQDEKYGKFQFKDEQRVNSIRSLVSKFVTIKKDIMDPILDFERNNLQNYKVIGIHKRGTDLFSNGHARGQSQIMNLDYIKRTIDEKLKQESFDKLFLATDEAKCYDELKNYYGSKFLIKQPTFLSPNNLGVHDLNRNQKEEERIKRGKEMIGDSYLLSRCNFCLNMRGSNVSLFSIFLRNDFNYSFIDDDVNYWY